MSAIGSRWIRNFLGACLLVAMSLASVSASPDGAKEAARKDAQAAVSALLSQNGELTKSIAGEAGKLIREFGWDSAAGDMYGIGNSDLNAFSAIDQLKPVETRWRKVAENPGKYSKFQHDRDALNELIPKVQGALSAMRTLLGGRDQLEKFEVRIREDSVLPFHMDRVDYTTKIYKDLYDSGMLTAHQYATYLDLKVKLKKSFATLTKEIPKREDRMQQANNQQADSKPTCDVLGGKWRSGTLPQVRQIESGWSNQLASCTQGTDECRIVRNRISFQAYMQSLLIWQCHATFYKFSQNGSAHDRKLARKEACSIEKTMEKMAKHIMSAGPSSKLPHISLRDQWKLGHLCEIK
ncbi:MAG: hypothetical protein AB2805_02380 [Candidatus Thiodiazotropha sp.]